MKHLLTLFLCFLGGSGLAMAGSNAGAISGSQSTSTSTSSVRASTGPSTSSATTGNVAGTQSSVVSNTLNFPGSPSTTTSNINYHASGTETIQQAPPVYAPGLTNSLTETCLGSASGGVSTQLFGLTFGKTTADEGCERRLDASIMARLEMKEVAFRIMCEQPDVYSASQGTNHPCPTPPQIKTETKLHPAPVMGASDIVEPQWTDPYIRARLGLPPIPKSMQAPQ